MRIATIILGRNLPETTDALVERFRAQDTGDNDIYVVESGTQQDRLSKYSTSWANWDDALKNGLRFARGFNFGLLDLIRRGVFADYDYFLLTRNTVEFDGPLASILLDEAVQHPHVGILSPCEEGWAEREYLNGRATAYVWHINHLVWLVSRPYIECLMERHDPSHMNLLYDGSNFRGYGTDTELIIKGYMNEFSTALTTRAIFRENTDLIRDNADLMRTEPYDVNQRLVFAEGEEWMRRKYGFNTRLQMQAYAKMAYDRYFALNPHLDHHRLS